MKYTGTTAPKIHISFENEIWLSAGQFFTEGSKAAIDVVAEARKSTGAMPDGHNRAAGAKVIKYISV